MTFKVGDSGNPNGRPRGVGNRLTRTVKESFEKVFNALQGEDYKGAQVSLEEWACANTTDFYKIASKLIPTKVEGSLEGLVVNLTTGVPKPAAPDFSDFA